MHICVYIFLCICIHDFAYICTKHRLLDTLPVLAGVRDLGHWRPRRRLQNGAWLGLPLESQSFWLGAVFSEPRAAGR